MVRLAREGLLGPLAEVNLPICEPYLADKACGKPFGEAVRATQSLELIHLDICGPMNVKVAPNIFSHSLMTTRDMVMFS